MARRLFIAGVFQETNVFSPVPTSLASFQQYWRPSQTAEKPQDINLLGYGAVWEDAQRRGLDVRPGLFASAVPSAASRLEDWRHLRDAILADLEAALPVDMVFLFLHGAMAAQGEDDCEGDLLEKVRAMAGDRAVIAAAFDLHGNVTPRMIRAADALVACKEYPHVDLGDASVRALDILDRATSGRPRPTMAVAKTPILSIAPTTSGPVQAFVSGLKALEEQPGVLAATAFYGFFGADHPDVGGCAVVVTDGDQDLADQLALQTGGRLIEAVQAQGTIACSLEDALDDAAASDERIVIADRADNAGGGAGSDSTWVLSALLQRNVRDVALGMIWDPVAVDFCHAAGEGARMNLRLGGKVGPLSGPPLDAEVEVLSVKSDVKQSWFGRGEANLPIGKSAAVRIGGVDVVLNSSRHQVFSRHVFEGHGIDLMSKHLIVVKSTQHFYENFSPLGRVIYCDTPGVVTSDLNTLPYKRLSRPIWPLDPDFKPKPVLLKETP